MKNKYVSAREIVEKYGLSYSSLNYYTDLGLFKVRKRNGNTRLYDDKEVRETRAKISKLVDSGYPLRLIQKVLKTV